MRNERALKNSYANRQQIAALKTPYFSKETQNSSEISI